MTNSTLPIQTNFDFEIGYEDGNVGMGVFARGDLITAVEAEWIINRVEEVIECGIGRMEGADGMDGVESMGS